MSPLLSSESAESRLRKLEASVARLEQRVDDITNNLARSLQEMDTDIRAFAPMIKDVVELQRDIVHMREAVNDCREGIATLKKDIAIAERERELASAETRKWRVGLAVAFVLGACGLIVQIILAVQA